MDFELLNHTADVKLRAYGASMPQLFIHAMQGMFTIIKPSSPDCYYDHDQLRCDTFSVSRTLSVESSGYDYLLADFLSDVLYLSSVHHEVYLSADIPMLTESYLQSCLYGVPVQSMALEIKAVTYHDLAIHRHEQGGYFADIVFDI